MLEARFHPQRRSRPGFETVGYIVWKTDEPGAGPVLEPAPRVPPSVVSKLNYFIAITGPDSFERLQTLQIDFWSFVPIGDDERSKGA
jgi:hypothetical protein